MQAGMAGQVLLQRGVVPLLLLQGLGQSGWGWTMQDPPGQEQSWVSVSENGMQLFIF